ncbi:MAG: ATPase, T2SS/T4P/T4SS family, partial [Patescibacteria group bacterium]
IAINAALTGHLVLATLHTNDAATTLPRMVEMEVENFLLAATARMVVAQRLVRKICDSCKESYELSLEQMEALGKKFNIKQNLRELVSVMNPGKESFTLYKGTGCEICNSSGYKGRTAIAEVMAVSDSIQKAILENQTPTKLEELAKSEGMSTLFEDGLSKVLSGITTLEEVLRVMRS